MQGQSSNSAHASTDTRPRCPYARLGLAWYRARYVHWQVLRDASIPEWRSPRNCADARYLANVWAKRSFSARKLTARWRERRARLMNNPTFAIMFVFGPVYGPQALRVASCESGRGVYASNGQYLGMFQMGSYARSKYGHSYTALGQAKAAYAYFVDAGSDWSPWSCKP